MQRFEIWSIVGWHGAGQYRCYHGSKEAPTFQQACYEYAADFESFKRQFDPRHMTLNGYKLYPSEQALIDSFTQQEAQSL